MKLNIKVTIFVINERRYLITHPHYKKSEKSYHFRPPVLSPLPLPTHWTVSMSLTSTRGNNSVTVTC